jgi:hypothetical protein
MTKNRGYTITELLVIMTMVAIAVALAVEFKRSLRPEFITAVSFNADGSRVQAALFDGTVTAWDVATGQQSGVLPSSGFFGQALAFSRDGSHLVRLRIVNSKSFREVLEVVDLATAKATEISSSIILGPTNRDVALTNDGSRVAICDAQGQAQIFDTNDGSTVTLGPLDGRNIATGQAPLTPFIVTSLAFSPDGNKLYVGTFDGQLEVWDIASNQVTRAPIAAGQSGPNSIHKFALSSDGALLAFSRSELTGSMPSYALEIRDANTLQIIRTATIQSPMTDLAFIDKGKSLLAMQDGGLEIWDVAQLQPTRQISAVDADVYQAAVSASGDRIATFDYMSVYVVEGNQLRQVGSIKTGGGYVWPLLIALGIVYFGWRTMRKRRATKTCTECGAKWREPKGAFWVKRSFAQCPKCRGDYLTTDELRRQTGRTNYALAKLAGWLFFLAVMFAWIGGDGGRDIGEIVWNVVWFVLILIGGFIGLIIFLMLFKIILQRFKLRRLEKAGLRLKALTTDSAGTGEIRRIGAMTVWADGSLLAPSNDSQRDAYRVPSADELSDALQFCRSRLEELLGEPCLPLPESQIFIFATTVAAQKFLPVQGISNEIPAVFCGPYANVGCVSLEGLRRQLRPLVTSIRSLFAYQSVPWPKYGYQLGYMLVNSVARGNDRAAIDATRRKIALWAAEGTLLPLSELCQRRFINTVVNASRSSLPEKYGKNLRRMNQWLSLGDYFCGVDSTPERREQFRKLWQTAKTEKKLSASIEQACGCSLAEFERSWKDWAQTASFGPPALPPSDIAAVAAKETIPLALGQVAPIQRRIRAIRVLGNCGWSIGAEPLLGLFKSPMPDIQREAFAAIRLLSGRMGTERAEDWQPWLAELNATEPRQLVGPQI